VVWPLPVAALRQAATADVEDSTVRHFWIFSGIVAALLVVAANPVQGQVKAGKYYIVNAESGRHLDADVFTINNNGTKVQLWSTDGENKPNRQWQLEKVGDDKFYIICVQGGRVLDADKGSIGKDSTKIQLWAGKNKEPNRHWRIESAGDDTYFIINVQSERLLDADKSTINQDGTVVWLNGKKSDNAPKSSKWKLIEVK
jgi:hypothetical protein